MKFSMKGNKGFSLIELMIVVGIIGILSTIAMPKLQMFMAKSKQSEVKVNLDHMFTLEMAYFGDQNSYGTLAQLGFPANPPGARYTYSVPNATNAVFTVQGSAAANALCSGSPIDTWTMDELKALNRANPGTPLTCN